MKNYEELAGEVRRLIGSDKTEKAIELLIQEEININKKQLYLLKGRFSKAKRNQRSGTIDNREANLEFNKINDSLLDIANELEKQPNKLIPAGFKRKHYAWLVGIVAVLTAAVFIVMSVLENKAQEAAIQEAQAKNSKAWQKARAEHSIESYSTFIRNYPEGDSVDVAKNYHEELIWEEASKENTSPAYQKYLNDTEIRKYETEANEKIGELKVISLTFVYDGKSIDKEFFESSKISEVKDQCLDQYEEKHKKIGYPREYMELVVDKNRGGFDRDSELDENFTLNQVELKGNTIITIQAKEVKGGYYFRKDNDKVGQIFLDPSEVGLKGPVSLVDANKIIKITRYNQIDNWKIPNKTHLRDLRNQIAKNPELFPDFPNQYFWTSSRTTNDSHKTMNLFKLDEKGIHEKTGKAYILPIRDISL